MRLFLAITVQMEHNQRDTKDYWLTLEQIYMVILWKHYEMRQAVIYLDFHILVTIKMNVRREMKITTDYEKEELYFTSSVILMPNITV
jgi:hypothetical protein